MTALLSSSVNCYDGHTAALVTAGHHFCQWLVLLETLGQIVLGMLSPGDGSVEETETRREPLKDSQCLG